ncbi:MAG: hypothetical protein RMJ03_06680 [Nitrososphaerota archaeon]|nr:hypothetical protein [Nitrososphaerota archaeon]
MANGAEKSQADCETICKMLLELLDLVTKKCLSVKQLKYLAKVKENSGLLFYQLVDKLSMELHVPKSTVRWNLRKLRDSGMIVAGNRDAKGVSVKLTEKGEIALQIMERKYEFLSKNNCPKALFESMQHLQSHGGLMTKQKESNKDNELKTKDSMESEEKFKLSFWYETRPEGP